MKTLITQAAIIFVAFGLIYAVLILIAGGMQEAFAQNILVSTGSAILAAGLTFFLLRVAQPGGK